MSYVAQTILVQLGGRRFLAMTGAKNLIGDEKSLSMRLPRGFAGNGIDYLTIRLEWDDTYTVESFKEKRTKSDAPQKAELEMVGRSTNVYCDVLQQVFTSLTGLYTHL